MNNNNKMKNGNKKKFFLVPSDTPIDRYLIKLLRKKYTLSKWKQRNIKQVLKGNLLLIHQNHILANF